MYSLVPLEAPALSTPLFLGHLSFLYSKRALLYSIDGRISIDRLRIPKGEINLAEIDRVLVEHQQYITGVEFNVKYSEVFHPDSIVKSKIIQKYLYHKNTKTGLYERSHLFYTE